MATLRNLGFEKQRNFFESTNDREILNNLGGGDIASDIFLFVNNTNNKSELVWDFNTDSSKIESNKFVFPTTVPFVYTNGDEVQVTGTSLGNLEINKMYYVVGLDLSQGDRRNQAAFGLSLVPNGSLVSLGTITNDVTFIRADIVTQENLLNIATPNILDSNIGQSGINFSYEIGASFGDAFSAIEGNIDGFNFLRSFKYIQNDSTAIDRAITIEGTLSINDPANFNSTQTNLNADKSPGLYISDPFSDVLDISKTRAFSTNAQPWEEGTGKLTTTSAQVNIGDLNFQNGISFNTITELTTVSGSVTEFTHKIPILINGVEYFVLLKS